MGKKNGKGKKNTKKRGKKAPKKAPEHADTKAETIESSSPSQEDASQGIEPQPSNLGGDSSECSGSKGAEDETHMKQCLGAEGESPEESVQSAHEPETSKASETRIASETREASETRGTSETRESETGKTRETRNETNECETCESETRETEAQDETRDSGIHKSETRETRPSETRHIRSSGTCVETGSVRERSNTVHTSETPQTPRTPAHETWPETPRIRHYQDVTPGSTELGECETKLRPSLSAKVLRSSSPPLAVSTPLQDTYIYPPSPSVDSSVSETSPLLPRDGRDLESGRPTQKAPVSARFLLSLAAFFALVLLAYFGFTFLDISDIVEQGFTPNAESVSVVSIDDDGVCVQVMTSIASHYSSIRNPFLRFSMYMAAAMVGSVSVATADKCDVYVGARGLDLTHVISASVPRIPLNLANNRVSYIEFNTSFALQKHGLAVLGNYFESCSQPPSELEVTVKMDPVIQKRLFKFTKKDETLSRNVPLNFSNSTALELKNLSLSLSEDELRVSVSAYSPQKVPVNYHLQNMQWELSVPDCDMKLRRLGVFNTSGMHIRPSSIPTTNINLLVSEVAPELLEECLDGISPFNKFMGSLANDNMIRAYVNTQPGQDLPKWLSDFLQTPHKVEVPIPADLQLFQPLFPESESNFEDLSVEVFTKDEKLSAVVSTKAMVAMEIPLKSSGFYAEASRVNYTMHIYAFEKQSGETQKGKGEVQRENGERERGVGQEVVSFSDFEGQVSLSMDKKEPYTNAIAWFPNTEVEVKNPTELGRILSIFLNGGFEFPPWTAHIVSADIRSKLLTTRIKDLVFQSKHLMGTQTMGRSIVDKFLANMQAKVENIVVASTSKKGIEIVVDFEFSNCLNMTLAVSESLAFDVSYNGTVIGTAEMSGFLLEESEKRQKFSTLLSLFYASESQRVMVEDFLSHVISGSNSTFIGVSGRDGDDPLSKMLREVEVRDLKVPQIDYGTAPETYGGMVARSRVHINTNSHTNHTTPETRSTHSPFLLGATIHLWSSEIEVTLLNPLSNMEINACIESCIASYDGHMLAHVEHSEVVVVPPGVYTTPRIPVEISKGIGADILRRALNGDLVVDVVAEISVLIGEFPAEVVYRGSGLTARIKI